MRKHALTTMAVALLASAGCTENSTTTPTITPIKECTSDGEIDCLTTATFPAASKALLDTNAAGIRASATIGGVVGTLADCASDNGANCVTSVAYPSVIKSAITPGGIMSGKVVAGITGTFAPPCTMDGQTGCLSDEDFKAGNSSAISAFDLRAGKTIGGVAARLTFPKNGAGPLADPATINELDTIDDYNNGGTFPASFPSDWLALSENFVRDPASDDDTDTECSGVEDCVYRDLNTGLYWAKTSAMTVDWEASVTICEALEYGTYTDWRMPSQKELLQAYIDGIYFLKDVVAFSLTDLGYHAATTTAVTLPLGDEAFRVSLATGEVTSGDKTTTARTICTRS